MQSNMKVTQFFNCALVDIYKLPIDLGALNSPTTT